MKKTVIFSLFLIISSITELKCFHDKSILRYEIDNVTTLRSKRELHVNHSTVIRGPYNSNRTSLIIELALVVDNAIYRSQNNDTVAIINRYKELVNLLNSAFQELGVFIALVHLEIWTDGDKIDIPTGSSESEVKAIFMEYAKNLMKDEHIDNAQLISKRANFGLSSTTGICVSACGVNSDSLSTMEDVAYNLAFSIISNLGVSKSQKGNCTKLFCGGSKKNLVWCDCVLEQIAPIIAGEKKMECLNDKPIRLFGEPVCGNGFTEPGEQCDCGLMEKCTDNPCCNATTCKFKKEASCAVGECCNLKTCKVHGTGTPCRSKSEDCDLPEYCDGQLEYCPDDVLKIIGESCVGGPECDINGHKCKGKAIQCEEIHCHDNGVCNSKGHCHCNDGFSPPKCNIPGYGGSIDSGPVRGLKISKNESDIAPINSKIWGKWNNIIYWVGGFLLSVYIIILVWQKYHDVGGCDTVCGLRLCWQSTEPRCRNVPSPDKISNCYESINEYEDIGGELYKGDNTSTLMTDANFAKSREAFNNMTINPASDKISKLPNHDYIVCTSIGDESMADYIIPIPSNSNMKPDFDNSYLHITPPEETAPGYCKN